ncbi:hypothetical protein CDL12_15508 [Handroanthus impetiginosus]|uniref:Ubiquitinyl hydrolase 1 n=1 Tax=Handroanthus impetiginosus TaxID=429701 RepID=A0A2G9H325_9LAMI|nr:hypothetical protein CDL12_15508 [Handroanthus impetiginosus]
MSHCYILIPHPRDKEVCRGRRKSKKIPQQLHCWLDALGTTQNLIEFFRLYRWGECKLPNKVHDAEDRLKTKDQEIKELKKRVAGLEAAVNKDLCVLPPAKIDVVATKEQHDRGAACEEQGDNNGKEKERKDKEKEEKEDKEMDEEMQDDKDEEEEEKVEEYEQKEDKTKEEQDGKKCEKEDGEDEEGKEKECEKEEERKDGDDDEERDHDADNEYNDINKKNQTKYYAGQVLCHHEVEMNKKLEAISRKLDFGQDVNFGERDYEAVRTLSSIVDGVQNRDELIKK